VIISFRTARPVGKQMLEIQHQWIAILVLMDGTFQAGLASPALVPVRLAVVPQHV
jgi:hypothetical protein